MYSVRESDSLHFLFVNTHIIFINASIVENVSYVIFS